MSAQSSKTALVATDNTGTLALADGTATKGGEVLVIDSVTMTALNGGTAGTFQLTISGDTRTIWQARLDVPAAGNDTLDKEWTRGLPCFQANTTKKPETNVLVTAEPGSGVEVLLSVCYHYERLSTFG